MFIANLPELGETKKISAVSWTMSYLKGRTQYVKIEFVTSDKLHFGDFGAPKGLYNIILS